MSSSTDSAYSEITSSPSSSHGDPREERLLDDVDEEYDSGKSKLDESCNGFVRSTVSLIIVVALNLLNDHFTLN